MLTRLERAAINETLVSGLACDCVRSRQTLWRKRKATGSRRRPAETRFDCAGDAVPRLADQLAAAGHTGRCSHFHNAVKGERVEVISAPIPLSIHQSKQ